MKKIPKDKRTKAYKKWLANEKKTQLNIGDKVAAITEATGVKAAVKFIFGEDCGCSERQESLNEGVNKIFGRKHVEPLTEKEYNLIEKVINQRGISHNDQIEMIRIYERVFQKKFTTSCTSCSFMANIYKPLEKLFNEYNEH